VRNCTAPLSALFVLAIAPALAAESANAVVAPADAFLAALADHCGKAYAGRIVAKHWSAVITYRSENIRIISVRRSRPEEVALYEG